jgi:hypothetical protein
MPAIVSNTSHGLGLRCCTPLFLAMALSSSSSMRRVEIACSPPPSIARIFRGLLGLGADTGTGSGTDTGTIVTRATTSQAGDRIR